MKTLKSVLPFFGILFILFFSQAVAAQKSGDGNAIPYPKEEWKGVQGKTLADSKPDFIGQPKAPESAPNVLIIMLDDAGYSNATSYGGVMKTPTFDRIGDEGIRAPVDQKTAPLDGVQRPAQPQRFFGCLHKTSSRN